jgi:hypothetical protein
MIKDLCPSKHYLLSGIMIFRRRSWRAYLHYLSKQIWMKVYKIRKNVNNDDILIKYLHSHFINVNKYSQYLYYIDTLGLSEGENVRVTRERLQCSVNTTVLLFIYLPTSTLWRPNGRGLHSTPFKWSDDQLEYHGIFLRVFSRLRGISTTWSLSPLQQRS